MADIKTITQEFNISGSLNEVRKLAVEDTMQSEMHESVQFLIKKLDEVIEEVNKLKNS